MRKRSLIDYIVVHVFSVLLWVVPLGRALPGQVSYNLSPIDSDLLRLVRHE